MRILHTIAYYPPDVAGGGATEVVRQISERLVCRGHDVTVATTFSPLRTCRTHNGVNIKDFKVHGVLGQAVLGIRGEKASFLKLLRNGEYDIIMNYAAQTWHTDLTCQSLASIRARTVLAACGYSGLMGWRRLLYWRYFQTLPKYLRLYDAIIYHACKYRDSLYGAHHGISNFRIIPNGVDAAEFIKPAIDFRAYFGIQTPYILLAVGDHYRNKGHDRVIEAFSRLNRSDVTLVLIGRRVAGRLRGCWDHCQCASREMGGRILMLSDAPRAHVAAAYMSASLFVSGSHIEAFPLVILEAMANGLPFVAFPAGNIAELPGGRIVSSTIEMAATINSLLDAPEVSAKLGAIGRQEQRTHYEWERAVDQYEALYKELLNRPKISGIL